MLEKENQVDVFGKVKDEIYMSLIRIYHYMDGLKKENLCSDLGRIMKWFREFEFELLNEKECELMENEDIVPLGKYLYITERFLEYSLLDKVRLVITEYVNYHMRDYLGRKKESNEKNRLVNLQALDCFRLITPAEDLENVRVSGWNEFKRNIYRNHILEVEDVEIDIELNNIVEFKLRAYKMRGVGDNGLVYSWYTKDLVFDKNTGKYITKNMNVRKEYEKSVEVLRDLGSVGQ